MNLPINKAGWTSDCQEWFVFKDSVRFENIIKMKEVSFPYVEVAKKAYNSWAKENAGTKFYIIVLILREAYSEITS